VSSVIWTDTKSTTKKSREPENLEKPRRDKNTKMITINITHDQVKRAEELYPFNVLNGSITNGSSNIYGALGEVVFQDYLSENHNVVICGNYDYDLKVDEYRVDVKTKRTTVVPKENYNCSISSWNTTQECDFYFFCRVSVDKKKAYILGYISKKDFYEKATFNKKGEKETDIFYFKDDCYNLPISDLHKFKNYINDNNWK
tara:strand:+ start:27 stop:629 length:603 start_codon:yes stop_codon:yes gene_type:complete